MRTRQGLAVRVLTSQTYTLRANDSVKVFDILYLNDKCLTHTRLSERKRLLQSKRIFADLSPYKGRLEFAEESRGKTGKDIRAMLERILESRYVNAIASRISLSNR
jgi:DNA ligase-4